LLKKNAMLIFPIQSLLSYSKCYEFLLTILHPHGLKCRCGHAVSIGQKAHKYNKTGLPSYACIVCKKVFNVFSDTIFQGIHYDCISIVLFLRGILQGQTTLHLSIELKLNYKNLLDWRHKLQEFAYENRDVSMLSDTITESDEVFINAGSKGELHPAPQDPPRVRANKKKG
jgi:hypothetical protein